MIRLEGKPPGTPAPERRGRRFIVPALVGAIVLIAVVILLRASFDTDDPTASERSAGTSNRVAGAIPRELPRGKTPLPVMVVPPPSSAVAAGAGVALDLPSALEPTTDLAGSPALSADAGSSPARTGSSVAGTRQGHAANAAREQARGDGAGGRADSAGHNGSGGAAGAQKVALAGDSARHEAVWQRPPSEADPSSKLVARFAPSGGATLKGRVVDAESGRPSAGVAVEAHIGDSFMKTATDGAGIFRMPGIFPGRRITVWIIGRSDTFVAERLDVTSPAEGETSDAGVVRLLRGDELASHLEGWMGMFVTRRGQRNVVAAVSPWSPADRAGIEVGDVLLSIAGRDVDGLGPRATGFLLRGPVGTKVGIAVQDRQGIVQKVQLERVLR